MSQIYGPMVYFVYEWIFNHVIPFISSIYGLSQSSKVVKGRYAIGSSISLPNIVNDFNTFPHRYDWIDGIIQTHIPSNVFGQLISQVSCLKPCLESEDKIWIKYVSNAHQHFDFGITCRWFVYGINDVGNLVSHVCTCRCFGGRWKAGNFTIKKYQGQPFLVIRTFWIFSFHFMFLY